MPTSTQFSSVAQSCPTLCDSMNRSTPGLPVHHQLLEFTQTHVHQVSDAIQPSHPLSSPSFPAPNPSKHQNPLDHRKSKRVPEKTSISALLTMLKPLTMHHNKLENSERDGNIRPPDLSLEKSICRSGSNS